MESAKEEAKKQYTGSDVERDTTRQEAMLQMILKNQPAYVEAPFVPQFAPFFNDVLVKYTEVLTAIGGKAYIVDNDEEFIQILKSDFSVSKRIVSFDTAFEAVAAIIKNEERPHAYENVDVCIARAPLAVSENGSVWISDVEMPVRVLPFIAQCFVAMIDEESIVPTMHDAYDVIADKDYGFATFIAGPSKTADIEQSLVIGAHGPKAMTVFIKRKKNT